MDPFNALTEVKKDLVVSFGEGLSARIIFTARAAVGAELGTMDREKYLALIKSVGKDDRLQKLWGDFGVKDKLAKWEKLV